MNFDPDDPVSLRLPGDVAVRLQFLLDQQGSGSSLTNDGREEAEGLGDLAE
jgi:hypothetical protein